MGDINSIKKLGIDEPLEEICSIYAITFMGIGKLDESEKYLNIANTINPVSVEILMKHCELCQANH